MSRRPSSGLSTSHELDSASAAFVRDEKINRLALICRAMFELLQPSGGIPDARLAAKIQEIDERDGQADGRMTPRGQVCPKFGATMSARFGRCLFCGYRDPSASPFIA